ncbi:MAG: BMP family ABC transporter substrate-binding protein [Faecalibacterium sp.]|jgi:basic membrane protein A|nr:BMP family ABC transporter substrate-binding protein [Faecalibacterium sp.]
MTKISRRSFLAVAGAAAAAGMLSACGAASSTASSAASSAAASSTASSAAATGLDANAKTNIAFITDVGNIDDQSFNQYTYQGVKDFCEANGLKANYYKPSEDSDDARLEQIDNAVNDGAAVIVMAGYIFAAALGTAQDKYPDTQFLAIDVGTGDLATPGKNVALVTFKEEQAGYLAGYSVVTDGYKKLGFLGGMSVPAVVRYGQGFVQGADAAAKELGASDVTMKYWYSGSFVATDEIKSKMDSWYSDGTEIVFACGGSICNSCVAAAQANNGKMVGVDVDQSYLDGCVVTSAMKALANSVNVVLSDCMANSWKFSGTYAGVETKLGAAEDCVGLPMEASHFNTFTQDQYDTLFKSLEDGSLAVDDASEATAQFATTTIKVDYQG